LRPGVLGAFDGLLKQHRGISLAPRTAVYGYDISQIFSPKKLNFQHQAHRTMIGPQNIIINKGFFHPTLFN
jgi:hypothetical protein